MRLRFVTVDVFTDRQFGGNPLAVVLDGQHLTDNDMQSIATEFNLAETTFVLPPKSEKHTAQVRIFTPKAELPFAGHPNIGTAFALAIEGVSYGRRLTSPFVFEEKAGLVSVDVVTTKDRPLGAMLSAPQQLTLGPHVPVQTIAEACCLPVSDIEMKNHAPRVASCGVPFVLAQLKNKEALAASQPRSEIFSKDIPMALATGIFLYSVSAEDENQVDARMFAPLYGIPEDPATGSAIAALVALHAKIKPQSDNELNMRIVQGETMGRRSVIHARAVRSSSQTMSVRVGGACVAMSEGILSVSSSKDGNDPMPETGWR